MKRIITLLLAISLMFALTGCSKTEAEKIADSYSSLESIDHVYDLIDYEEIDTVVADLDKAIIYFGSPIWPACVQLVPELDRLAKDFEVETIYYVHLEYTSDLAIEFAENGTFDYVGTPLVVFYENGEVSYSNFTYRNPDSEYYNEDTNYYLEIVRMFQSF
mgnify:CR=1 FL=1